MANERGGIDRSESIEDLHHLRLMALLDELVRDKGPRRAAADLDVDHRTLTASLASGKLSRRMRVALNQALLSGAGSPAGEQRQRNDELEGRVEKLEEQVKVVAEDSGQGVAAVQAVHGEIEALRNEHGQALQSVDSRLAQVERGDGDGSSSGGSGGPPPSALGKPSTTTRAMPRRDFPELATMEPAADDEDVFGDAWPLIQEWRELRNSHPDRGRGLEGCDRRSGS